MFVINDKSIKNRALIEVVSGPILNADGTVTQNQPVPKIRSFNAPRLGTSDIQNYTTYEGENPMSSLYKSLHEDNYDVVPVLSDNLYASPFIGRIATKSYNCHRIFKGTDIDYDAGGTVTTDGYNYYALTGIPIDKGWVFNSRSQGEYGTTFRNYEGGRYYATNVMSINVIFKDSMKGRFPINYFNIRSISRLGTNRPRISSEPGDYRTNKVTRYFTVGNEGYWLVQYCERGHTFTNQLDREYTVWNPSIEIPEAYKDMDWQIVSFELRDFVTDWNY